MKTVLCRKGLDRQEKMEMECAWDSEEVTQMMSLVKSARSANYIQEMKVE